MTLVRQAIWNIPPVMVRNNQTIRHAFVKTLKMSILILYRSNFGFPWTFKGQVVCILTVVEHVMSRRTVLLANENRFSGLQDFPNDEPSQ